MTHTRGDRFPKTASTARADPAAVAEHLVVATICFLHPRLQKKEHRYIVDVLGEKWNSLFCVSPCVSPPYLPPYVLATGSFAPILFAELFIPSGDDKSIPVFDDWSIYTSNTAVLV